MRQIFASAHPAIDDAEVFTLEAPVPSAYIPDPTLLAKLELILHAQFDRFEHEQELSDKLYPVALEALQFALTSGTTVALKDPYGPFVVVGILSTIGGNQLCFKEASARGFSGGMYDQCDPQGLHDHCRLLMNRLNRFMKPSPLSAGHTVHLGSLPGLIVPALSAIETVLRGCFSFPKKACNSKKPRYTNYNATNKAAVVKLVDTSDSKSVWWFPCLEVILLTGSCQGRPPARHKA